MKRILIVEDNTDNLLIYSTMLEHLGYTVLVARNGTVGLEMAVAEMPDLILMDVSVPGVDGWEATRTLKASEKTARIPIIVLTAHALAADRQRAYDSGANGYVAKPATPMTVADAVRRMLADPLHAVGFEDLPART